MTTDPKKIGKKNSGEMDGKEIRVEAGCGKDTGAVSLYSSDSLAAPAMAITRCKLDEFQVYSVRTWGFKQRTLWSLVAHQHEEEF